MPDVGDRIILRVDYRKPVFVISVFLAAFSTLLWAFDIAGGLFWLIVWLLVVLGSLLLVFIIAWTLNFLKLTPAGFSSPIHAMRTFTKWSEVERFESFEKRLLGFRYSGVGFIYSSRNVIKANRNLCGYNRIILGNYGGMDPPELARFLNQWRVKCATELGTSKYDMH
jgi:hypothetical protein